jgi:CHAD domain-containing protein
VNEPAAYDRGMRALIERELKLDVEAGFELPPLHGRPLESRLFTSTYHDTPPRSLARVGITLRRRIENGVSRWQLKLPQGGTARAELEALGGPVGPPEELRALLAAHLRYGDLEEVATLRTRRNGVLVEDGDRSVAEVTVDAVDVLDGGRFAPGFVELEVELIEGGESDLQRLGRTLRKAGARRSDGRPKLLRTLAVDFDPGSDGGAPALEQTRALLTRQLRELERHDPGVRRGAHAEDLHQFRVATRRTRAVIRATRPLLGDLLTPLEDELKWLAGVLGPVRDLDVLIERLRAEAGALDHDRGAVEVLVATLEAERTVVRDALLAALESPRYLALLSAFEASVASLPVLDVSGVLRPLAAGELERLSKAARRLPDEPTDDELHAVRIRAKRARYSAELAALDGGPAIERYVAALKDLQDVIGEHQDAVVAEAQLRRIARAQTAVAAGRLIERDRARRRDRRDAYPSAIARALRRGKRALG